MAFNITEITSAINKNGGLAKPNMFFVRITPPSSLALSPYRRDAMFFCDAAQLPGINFTAQSIKSVGYGTSEQRPIDAGFSPVNTTFIVDANGKALRFFQQWLALINNWSRETTGVMQGTQLSYGEWNYPSTYEGTVEIHSVNPVPQPDTGNVPPGSPISVPGNPGGRRGSTLPEVISYQLSRAFPIQVGDISVAWEMNDAIMRLPVVFAYNSWNTSNVPSTSSNENLNAPSLSSSVDILRSGGYGYGVSLLQNGAATPSVAAEFANLT